MKTFHNDFIDCDGISGTLAEVAQRRGIAARVIVGDAANHEDPGVIDEYSGHYWLRLASKDFDPKEFLLMKRHREKGRYGRRVIRVVVPLGEHWTYCIIEDLAVDFIMKALDNPKQPAKKMTRRN